MDEATKREAAANAAALVRSVFDGSLGEDAGLMVITAVTNGDRVDVRDAVYNLSLVELIAIIHEVSMVVAENKFKLDFVDGLSPKKIADELVITTKEIFDAVAGGFEDGLKRCMKKEAEEDEEDKG